MSNDIQFYILYIAMFYYLRLINLTSVHQVQSWKQGASLALSEVQLKRG